LQNPGRKPGVFGWHDGLKMAGGPPQVIAYVVTRALFASSA
jgi:hypothetical protein